MGRVKEKSGTSLNIIFLKYLGAMLGTFILWVVVLEAVFALCFYYGLILPANYGEKMAAEAASTIEKADKVTEEMIPELSEYAVFDTEGNMRSGNIPEEYQETAWSAVYNGTASYGIHHYKAIERADGYCILQYKMAAQYRSAFLRKYLMAPEILMIVLVLMSVIVIIILFSLGFGKRMRKKLVPLLYVVDKIKEQELDYEAEKSGVKEIDDVLTSIAEMREALKSSLEAQWKTEQEKSRQLSALAHDIKTPLTVVRGNTELLEETELTEEQKGYADYISNSAMQMQSYVQTLIEVAKSEAGHAFSPSKIELDVLMKEIEVQAKGLAAVHKLQLNWIRTIENGMVVADMEQLIRAVMNIISNAADYTLEGGRIEVHVGKNKDQLTFIIEDTGKGFTNEALKHGTEQFFMGDKSRSVKSHYGIGLFEAKRIAEKHGGELKLENGERLGGAKVTIGFRMKE